MSKSRLIVKEHVHQHRSSAYSKDRVNKKNNVDYFWNGKCGLAATPVSELAEKREAGRWCCKKQRET